MNLNCVKEHNIGTSNKNQTSDPQQITSIKIESNVE